MEYSHWEYNTDDEEEDRANNDELYTDDDEEADAASDENLDYWIIFKVLRSSENRNAQIIAANFFHHLVTVKW